jgi:hypothetical protein
VIPVVRTLGLSLGAVLRESGIEHLTFTAVPGPRLKLISKIAAELVRKEPRALGLVDKESGEKEILYQLDLQPEEVYSWTNVESLASR